MYFEDVILIEVGDKASFYTNHFGYLVENELFWAGYGSSWEGTSLKIWALAAQYSNVILDIGANTGAYSLAAGSVNPEANIYAFEPVEQIATKIQRNAELNAFEVNVHAVGVSSKTGEAIIYEPKSEHAYSASFNSEILDDSHNIEEKILPVIRIDDFVKENGIKKIDLVKMDVERFELEVLTGFGDIIKRDKPTFLIEVLGPEYGRSFHQFFENLGYKYFIIDEGIGLRQLDTFEGASNFLVCTDEMAEKLKLGERISHEDITI